MCLLLKSVYRTENFLHNLMSRPMYKIPSGSLKDYYICKTCGSVLDIYIDYHRCLLYSNIVKLHMDLLQCLQKCPFYTCYVISSTVKDYMHHLLAHHQSVIVYSCPNFGVGFITKSGLVHHKPFCY